jgi:hypothetical protein
VRELKPKHWGGKKGGKWILFNRGAVGPKSLTLTSLLHPLRSRLLKIRRKSQNTGEVKSGKWILFNPGAVGT